VHAPPGAARALRSPTKSSSLKASAPTGSRRGRPANDTVWQPRRLAHADQAATEARTIEPESAGDGSYLEAQARKTFLSIFLAFVRGRLGTKLTLTGRRYLTK
jgi:hypothetical protein